MQPVQSWAGFIQDASVGTHLPTAYSAVDFQYTTFRQNAKASYSNTERGSTYENCSSISGLNLSADRPGSDDSWNRLMGIPLFAVVIPTSMILLRWICKI